MQIRNAIVAAVAALIGVGAHAATFERASSVGFTAPLAASPVTASDLVIDLTGITTDALEGDAANTVMYFDLGAGTLIDGISYMTTMTAYSPSYLSEMAVTFTNSSGDGVILTPGFEDTAPGTASYADSAMLSDYDLAFNLGADGMLKVEFHETFNDSSVNPDGLFVSGNLTFMNPVPEPGTYGLMAMGLLAVGGIVRRRRAA